MESCFVEKPKGRSGVRSDCVDAVGSHQRKVTRDDLLPAEALPVRIRCERAVRHSAEPQAFRAECEKLAVDARTLAVRALCGLARGGGRLGRRPVFAAARAASRYYGQFSTPLRWRRNPFIGRDPADLRASVGREDVAVGATALGHLSGCSPACTSARVGMGWPTVPGGSRLSGGRKTGASMGWLFRVCRTYRLLSVVLPATTPMTYVEPITLVVVARELPRRKT